MSVNDVESNATGHTLDAITTAGIRMLNQKAEVHKKNLKNLNKERTGLLSPAGSEEPDEERLRANNERIAKEAEKAKEAEREKSEARFHEIKRIISCPDDAYDEILDIKPGTENIEKERTRNFVTLACLLHPVYARAPQIVDAYIKLHSAAIRLDLDGARIAEVKGWDGKEKIDVDADDMEIETESVGDDNTPEEDLKPMPPTWVTEVYMKATDLLKNLSMNPIDGKIMKALEKLNNQILNGNGGPETKEDLSQWQMPISFFQEHYKKLKSYDVMSLTDGEYKNVVEKKKIVRDLITVMVEQNHFPNTWKSINQEYEKKDDEIDTPMEYFGTTPAPRVMDIHKEVTHVLKELWVDPHNEMLHNQLVDLNTQLITCGNVKGAATHSALFNSFPVWYQGLEEINKIPPTDPKYKSSIDRKVGIYGGIERRIVDNNFPIAWGSIHKGSTLDQINYPWYTIPVGDTGSRIIGVRKVGRGKQVCIEMKEGQRWIRRLEAASENEIGTQGAQEYLAHENSKKLSDGQSEWTKEEKESFLKLHWVTRSQIKRRNKAASWRDPVAYCCVELKGKGITIITATSFRGLRGKLAANTEIEEVCRQDQIAPPWEAKPLGHYSDRSKRAKTVKKRRELEDEVYNKRLEAEYDSAYDSGSDELKKLRDDVAKLTAAIAAMAERQGDRAVAQNVELSRLVPTTE
ncbi:hypothetical protein V8C42DRAFT_338664 [Trichoderma barbatum]